MWYIARMAFQFPPTLTISTRPLNRMPVGYKRTAAQRNASETVRRAIIAGKLARPAACSKCGKEGRIEASHSDYSRPLDVEWLCVSCHRSLDKVSPKGGATFGDTGAGPHNKDKTHCPKGHEYTPDNIYWARNGTNRICATCKKETERLKRAAKRCQ